MALFGANFENDTLRAIEHARLMLATGSGLETVVASIAAADLGGVSSRFRQVIRHMHTGATAQGALEWERKHTLNRPYQLLLEALCAEGSDADHRLLEASHVISDEAKVSLERSSNAMQFWIKVVSVLLCGPIFYGFLQFYSNQVGPNPTFLPALQLSRAFTDGFFAVFGVLLAGCLIGMCAKS